MPNPFPGNFPAPAFLAAAALFGCFGSEPDDNLYTVPKGESYEGIQLEIEPDGTVLILGAAAMYMAKPESAAAGDRWAQVQNYRSVLLRRTTGGWNATEFKNLQESINSFPVLLAAPAGRYQAILQDGAAIKRFGFGNGAWGRLPGLPWPEWVEYSGTQFGYGNWTRHSRLALSGDSSLVAVHQNWEGGYWATEGGSAQRTRIQSGSMIRPMALHAGPGYRGLLVSNQSTGHYDLGKPGGLFSYYLWKPGADSALEIPLDARNLVGEAFFAPFKAGTALYFTDGKEAVIHVLDSEGRLAPPDTVPFGDTVVTTTLAADAAGCLHFLDYVPDERYLNPHYLHRNTCVEGRPDTLVLPKPKAGADYRGQAAKLRIAPDGTPVAAFILQEADMFYPPPRAPASHIYLAEFRGGKWHLEEVDRRPGPDSPAETHGQAGGF